MGRATALTFGKAGASVIVADMNEAGGHETVSLLESAGSKAHFVKTDISKSADVQNLVAETVTKFGKLDVAINNAALTPDTKQVIDFDEDHWNRIIAVNLTGTALCVKYELQQMKKQGTGGSIVNVASAAAFKSQPNMPAYVTAKHGILGLTKSAAMESGEYGVRVNNIAPGAVNTDMLAVSLVSMGKTYEGYSKEVSWLNRTAEPHEIAQGSLWLASDASSYVTGVTLSIDAGFSVK